MANVNDFGIKGAVHTYTQWLVTSAGTVLIKSGVGRLRGVFVSSVGASPYLEFYDSTGASSGTIARFIPAAATFYQFGDPVMFSSGLYISGGTTNFTAIYY